MCARLAHASQCFSFRSVRTRERAREGRNNFTRATREVATRQALHARKLDREQIAAIMTRTVTHVGVNDLSESQWLAIALRYADALSAGGGALSAEDAASSCSSTIAAET
jgi:hypothetical protein